MKFTVDEMMKYSFVMAMDEVEYMVFCGRMKNSGFKDLPPMYKGIYPSVLFGNGRVNACALNHFVFVNMAKTLGYPHVTIFESDACPMKGCYDELGRFFEEHGVPDDAHEISLGNLHWIKDWNNGNKRCHKLIDVNNGYGRAQDDLCGAHAVIVFKAGYDTWLNSYIERRTEINADSFNQLTPKFYAAQRSFFLQKKDVWQYYDWISDKEHLSDFV